MKIDKVISHINGWTEFTYWNEQDVHCRIHGTYRKFDIPADGLCPRCAHDLIVEWKRVSVPDGCLFVDVDDEWAEP